MSGSEDGHGAPKSHCPMCGKSTIQAFRPFCSRRCADVDLGRWLTGAYAVPAVEDPDGFEELEARMSSRDDEPDILH